MAPTGRPDLVRAGPGSRGMSLPVPAGTTPRARGRAGDRVDPEVDHAVPADDHQGVRAPARTASAHGPCSAAASPAVSSSTSMPASRSTRQRPVAERCAAARAGSRVDGERDRRRVSIRTPGRAGHRCGRRQWTTMVGAYPYSGQWAGLVVSQAVEAELRPAVRRRRRRSTNTAKMKTETAEERTSAPASTHHLGRFRRRETTAANRNTMNTMIRHASTQSVALEQPGEVQSETSTRDQERHARRPARGRGDEGEVSDRAFDERSRPPSRARRR